MSFFGNDRRNTAKRLGTAFAAVLVWLSVCLVPAFAFTSADVPVGQTAALSGGFRQDAVAGVLPAIPGRSEAAPRQTLENMPRQCFPVASNETDSSRAYVTGNAASAHEKTPAPKLSVFMENAGLSHLFVNHTSAVFFSDKEAEAIHLFIIHFLHDQDGLKG